MGRLKMEEYVIVEEQYNRNGDLVRLSVNGLDFPISMHGAILFLDIWPDILIQKKYITIQEARNFGFIPQASAAIKQNTKPVAPNKDI